MTDVRLTALNPVDSQVYPVACNTSGELLVADGGGEYLPLTGGDLTGDLTLGTDKITLDASDGSINAGGGLNLAGGASGSADAPGIEVYKNTSTIGNPPLFINQGNTSGYLITGRNGFSGVNTFTVGVNGNATFEGEIRSNSQVNIIRNDDSAAFQIFKGTVLSAETNRITLSANGTITAANTAMFGAGVDTNSTTAYGIKCEVATNAGGLIAQTTQVASGFTYIYRAYRGSGVVFYVLANGNAAFTGTVTATVVPPSDARFKENITPAKPQLADVVALGGILKNYDWNDEAPVNDEIRAQRQLGLIAQEAAEICPTLVKELGSEENRYKGIPMEALIMKLIGAVSELKTELDQLKIT